MDTTQPITASPTVQTVLTNSPPAVAVVPVVQATVDTVYNHPAVSVSGAASVVAQLLQALLPLTAPAEDLAGADPKVRAIVALSETALAAIIGVFFRHPNSQG